MNKKQNIAHNSLENRDDEPDLAHPPYPAEVYDAVLHEGEKELNRGLQALWWSGVSAGLSMGFSIIASAVLAVYFGEYSWSHPLISVGYSVGFIIVILARQHLFTECTITALLPVLADYSWAKTHHLARLWTTVFIANMFGCAIFAWITTQNSFLSQDIRSEIFSLSHHMFSNTAAQMFLKGIPSGWIIAALIWVLASANTGRLIIILFFTWLIALGGFTHIIAGSIEAFHLLFIGEINIWKLFSQFMFPTLFGNIVGGSAIFSLISYAQVRKEVE